MRRILKLLIAGALAAAVAQLLRRWLELDDAGGPASSDAPATAGSNGDQPTREQLYREAQEIGIEGRSKMNKRQLQEAVEAAKTGGRS